MAEYSEMSREERRGVFTRMMGFLRKINVTYKCFRVGGTKNFKKNYLKLLDRKRFA